jgi:hypothetical protein
MLGNLSPRERETLLKLERRGPAANFDQIALSKLFKRGLVEVDSERRIALTAIGCQVRDELVASGFRATDDSGYEIPARR